MAGLSMEDLAAKLGGLVTKQAISKYEQGRMMPSPEVLERLISVLRDATWGASPLRAEDAHVEPRLPLACPQCAEPSPMAFRRQGLLRRLIRSGTGEPVNAKEAGGPFHNSNSEAVDSKDDICCCIISPDARIPLSGSAREIPDMTGEDAVFQRGIPSAPELNALASITDRRTRYLEAWRSDPEVNRIQFRAGEKLSAKTEAALKHRIADHLQKYLELESALGASAAFENPLAGHAAGTGEEVEGAAAEVRRRWELGNGPVVNLLGLLEDKGIKVYETRGIEGFEGLSGRFGRCPFVAVNVDRPPDRVRFTAAHELGHVMCDLSAADSPESGCHAFGAAFLLPRSVLERRFTTSRRKVTMGELGEIKETYGISLQAIMYRAHGLGLVTDRQLRSFRETIKAKGWIVEEPVAYAGLERAGRFRRLLHNAVAADILDVAAAAEMAGVSAEVLAKDIGEVF